MVVTGYNKNDKVIIISCDCGCDEEIHIKKFIDEDMEEYYLTLNTSKFYANQKGIFRLIGHRIKLAFKMLFGKEYRLTELVLDKDDINALIKNLQDIQEK